MDKNGLRVFPQILEFGKKRDILLRWGSKGFSLNLELDAGFVGLFFGYPPNSVFKQSIYTAFEEINKKVNNAEEVIEFCRTHLENLGYFTNARSNLKWVIDKAYSDEDVKRFFDTLENIILKIKENGLK